MKPTIAVTMGDPAGIGPEIAQKALTRRDVQAAANVILIGNPDHVKQSRMGKPSAFGGRASGDYIKRAVELAQTGVVNAIVTCPINKVSFRLGGWGKKFVGHTEMLAALSKTTLVRSMLVHENIRAVHVTSHIPLREVPRQLSIQKIIDTIVLARQGLKQLGIKNPRVGVAGLNPHAGDGGLLGLEEKKIIQPAVQWCKKHGHRAKGPISADVLWPMVRLGVYDAGVAMYHDQGQIAVKLAAFQAKRATLLASTGFRSLSVSLLFAHPSITAQPTTSRAGESLRKKAWSMRFCWRRKWRASND